MFELVGRKKPSQRQQRAMEGDDVLYYLKWWKRSWDLCVVFSVTQTAAICRKDTVTLGKQMIHLYSDTCIW